MAVRKTKAGTFECDIRDQYGHKRLRTFDTKREAVAYERDAWRKWRRASTRHGRQRR